MNLHGCKRRKVFLAVDFIDLTTMLPGISLGKEPCQVDHISYNDGGDELIIEFALAGTVSTTEYNCCAIRIIDFTKEVLPGFDLVGRGWQDVFEFKFVKVECKFWDKANADDISGWIAGNTYDGKPFANVKLFSVEQN